MSSTSFSSFDDSDFASFTYKQAILFIGLRVDPRLREIIEGEVSRLNSEIRRLRQENDQLRGQTKEYIKDVLAEFDSE